MISYGSLVAEDGAKLITNSLVAPSFTVQNELVKFDWANTTKKTNDNMTFTFILFNVNKA
jgi:hypothetical protein